jgi:hypothetical protein
MRKQAPAVVVAFLLGCLAMGLIIGRPSLGQQAPVQNPAPSGRFVGRYQMTMAMVASTPYIVVVDTATGRTWSKPTTSDDDEKTEWTAYGSPEDGKNNGK